MSESLEVEAQRPDGSKVIRTILTNRTLLLLIVLVVVIGVLLIMSATGEMSAPYDVQYMFASLVNLVPLLLLAGAEFVVILSGKGGIDLSVGSIVSLTGMMFGFAYGQWGWPLLLAIPAAILFGAFLGAINGFLIARIGFPAMIATLATYYAYWSLAMVINNQKPISTEPIQGLYALSKAYQIPGLSFIPPIPLGTVIFLLPTIVLLWYLISKTVYGRRVYAIGTNDTAARWSGIRADWSRFWAYVIAGAISGVVAIVTVSQFASARPDSGVSGNGMALPAITIAVLGGVAITGGIGALPGIILAALLIVWLDAGLLLAASGNVASQLQLLALGLILIGASLLNVSVNRRYGVKQ